MPGALAISVAPEALRLHLGAFCNLPRAALRLGAYDHLRVAAKSNSTAAGPRSLSRLSRRMDVDQAFDEIGAGCDVVVTPPTNFRPWLQPSATLRTESACDYRVGLADQCARYRTGPRSASTARRSPSTAAFSTLRSARAFASTVSLSARLVRLVCRRSSSAARSFDRGAAPASAAWSGYGGRPVARLTRSASLFMSSRPEEFHLQALPEPYVNLSIHTAPDVRPFP